MKKVISLGWGRQSVKLALASALGESEKADLIIHSDTTHERSDTYEYAKRYTEILSKLGVDVITVKPSRTLDFERADTNPSIVIPAYSLREPGYYEREVWSEEYRNENGVLVESELVGMEIKYSDGKGVLRRQCTQRWKIAPMRKYLRQNYPGETFEMWLGISLDEVERAKPSDVKYITNRFPLLEQRETRQDCERWILSHGYEVPPKSACVFCPYHSKKEWREIKEHGNGDWQKAVMIDEQIRNIRPVAGQLFVHSSRKPLSEVGDEIESKPSLFSDECEGYCFL